MNVFSFLIERARTSPDRPVCLSRERVFTYGELFREAEVLRDALVSHGLRPGMGMALIADNSPEFIVGLFAGLACEAVVMPISPTLKQQELQRTLELVPMAVILHNGSLTHRPKHQHRGHVGQFEILIRPKEFHCKVASGVPGAALIRFTSGTTGSSKGVVLSHTSVALRTEAAAEALGIQAGTRVLWVLPMAHHFIVSILTYVRYGATIILPATLSSQDILEASVIHSADLLYAAPSTLETLPLAPDGYHMPPGIRVISTSTGISKSTISAFEERFQVPVSQLYGLIEVGLPLGNLAPHRFAKTSVGVATPRYDVAILDPVGRQLPAGQIGHLAVRGPGMFDAYLAPYRPRDEVLSNGWFLTGDLATQGYDGAITVCGRETSVIHAGDDKVFPEEVEGILNSFPDVRTSRVFSVSKTQHEEMLVAEVVQKEGTSLDIEALQSYTKERLSEHKIPSRFVLVGDIPLTHTGKVIRAA